MRRIGFTVIGILTLALVAAGLTEATLAVGHRSHLSDDKAVRSRIMSSPSPKVTPPPTPALTPTPSPTPAGQTARTNDFVYLRAGASTSTAILASLKAGTTVTLGPYSDSYWQEVQYNDLHGYIYKTYLNY